MKSLTQGKSKAKDLGARVHLVLMPEVDAAINRCDCMPKHPLRTEGTEGYDASQLPDCTHRSVHWAVKLKSVAETSMCRQNLRDHSE